jgi:protein SCO1/2
MSKKLAVAAAAFVVAGTGATFAMSFLGGGDIADCGASAVAGGDIGGAFELLDKNGNLVTDEDIITEPTLIYFGFTFCPDFCPVDMARNSQAVDLLAEEGISATPVFISIDPERDTPQIVGDYAYNFHDKAIGLTGSAEQVDAASKAYRTFYKKDSSGDPEYYLMQHTTLTYLSLPEIGFVEFFRNTNTAEEVAETVSCYVNAQ